MRLSARITALAATTAVTAGLLAATSTARGAVATYDEQLLTSNAIFRINAPNNAGAQEFTTDAAQVDLVSAYLVNEAAHGSITAEIRTDPTDPATRLGSSTVDVSDLGGWGRGWVEFGFDQPVDLEPGSTYALVLQASGTDGVVVWNGRRATIEGALPSWNYDLNYWGGWKRYDETTPYSTTHVAFAVQPGDASRCQTIGGCYTATPRPPAPLHWEGLIGNDTTVVGIDAAGADGARFVPFSDVLELADGRLRYVPAGAEEPVTVESTDAGARARVAADSGWLHEGVIPGRTADERQAAARALLDMRMLLQENGSIAAAWWSIWQYAWPRDGSFAAAAFAHTGHAEEALSILRFFAGVQRDDGTWEARYRLDGSPVDDGRRWQLDANGWVPWAVWQWYQAAPPAHRQRQLQGLWPMVSAAADYAAGSLQDNGLPEVSPDYWENAVDAPTIANSGALLSGLRASADIAVSLGHRDAAARWARAAETLEQAIHREFGPYGYPRTPREGAGADSLVTVMMPPFVPETEPVREAVQHAADVLTLPNGGILPGEDWRGNPYDAWTPETAMFALQAAATGRTAEAEHWLGWLLEHRTALGSLPEKVRADGEPLSVAPLAWTDSIVVLALAGLDQGLPTPPDPCTPSRRVLPLCP